MGYNLIQLMKMTMTCSAMFKDDEIPGVIRECSSSKSPEPDDFNFNFIKSNWGILGGDIIKALHWFHETDYILSGCNASFMTLIPKCENLRENPIS